MSDDLLRVMRQRLADAEADAAALRAAIVILEQDAGDPHVSVSRRPPRRKPVGADARTVVPLGTLLNAVAEHPGQTNSWLAKHTGGDQGQLLALLKEAEQGGNVRREGERRGTRWWVTSPS